MTDDEKQQIAQLVTDAQGLTLSAISQAMAMVVAHLAWHVHSHGKLRADLKQFLRDFAPDKPDDQANELMHSMIEAMLRKILLHLSEVPICRTRPMTGKTLDTPLECGLSSGRSFQCNWLQKRPSKPADIFSVFLDAPCSA